MSIIVQKFGGTSVSTNERRSMVVDKIMHVKNQGKSVVVVVSAMGRKGDPYATDTIRNLALETNPYCSLKNIDLLMSCGEIISAVSLASMLELSNEKTVVLTGAQAGIVTDDNFSNAEILNIDEGKILPYLEEGYIVIVCGFQGATDKGEITTLGRGGSDTTATALGVALGAQQVEIYTDVDGIMTADPNVVPTAKIIDEINYADVFQMADKGAKVIHPRAVEIAQKGNILVKIKNTMSDHPGTSICYCRGNKENLYSTDTTQKLLTAITSKDHIAQVSILMEDNLERDSQLLAALSDAKISIDMINFFVDRKVFVIDETQVPLIHKILKKMNVQYTILDDCSKVTIIGSRITGIPGVMSTIVRALSNEQIKILQTSDSQSTISCLVKKPDAKRAVNILHEAFHLYK
ncbi:aspartate kinase [Alkaliphilus hydrothermalis]|uniref:Aspartokinase n=1 Tax=Alkaliphilus hydrothermalis TaxID=1482730 RepID=A0ABS2NSS6_9FIRM|nr:aspartate kinase [Alkaliphilus hydrothermalis]MBM7616013.1 aspartate kinase [Alkaliphilus hydrothermalis]